MIECLVFTVISWTWHISGVAYNEQKESAARWEAKKKELERIEAAKKRAADKSRMCCVLVIFTVFLIHEPFVLSNGRLFTSHHWLITSTDNLEHLSSTCCLTGLNKTVFWSASSFSVHACLTDSNLSFLFYVCYYLYFVAQFPPTLASHDYLCKFSFLFVFYNMNCSLSIL